MRTTKRVTLLLVALAFVVTLTAVGSAAQSAANARPVQVPQGQRQKVQGVVSVRSGDSFKVREPGGAETTVLLTADTDVTNHSRIRVRRKYYPVTYIMRGLRLQARRC